MSGGFTSYGFMAGGTEATTPTTTASPKIVIDYELHFRLYDERDNLRDWGQDIESKTHSVQFTYPIPNNPWGQTISSTRMVNKWSDYLDDDLPAFKPAIDEIMAKILD